MKPIRAWQEKPFGGQVLLRLVQDGEDVNIVTCNDDGKEEHLVACIDQTGIWRGHGIDKDIGLPMVNGSVKLSEHDPDRQAFDTMEMDIDNLLKAIKHRNEDIADLRASNTKLRADIAKLQRRIKRMEAKAKGVAHVAPND